tara:strand:+ start:979 stop:2172 length:1194 start_codon:yes stop_codon:yes gene_type:complete
MNYLIIILISFSYISAESITIYANQSASYRASGSGSSGCCSLNSIGYNNSNTLSAGSCIWWSQYGQCERRTSYPIWSFNFLQLPSNATVVSVSFDAEGLYDEWHDSYMALSSETGEITIQMGSYLVNGGDWSIDGQTWTWWNQGLNINQELPVSEVELGIDSGQLNVAVHEYDATIINSGLNAPRLVIEYELLDYECSEMDEFECGDSGDCDWVENIEYGNCSNYSNGSTCDADENCFWDLCYGGSYGSWSHCCRGGTYQIDNSYCLEVEVLECSEMYQLGCINDDSCEWIENIDYESCSNLEAGTCTQAGCNWYCDSTYTWLCYCTGGSYEIDNSYCEEVSFLPGDVNGDGSLNVSDIVLIVDLILGSDYDENSDINQDGILNIMDVVEIINNILN